MREDLLGNLQYQDIRSIIRFRAPILDNERPGRVIEVTMDEIYDIVLAKRRVKIREIAEIVGLFFERMQNILHEHLGMRQQAHSNYHIEAVFIRNPNEFLRRFVAIDETWIHGYMPEMKEQSKQRTSPGEFARMVPSAEKVMATVF